MAEPAQILLPFAEREYIDVPRCCRILGVSGQTVRRLAEDGDIHLIEYRRRGWKKIRYQSVIDLCDRLRERYLIEDRRPRLSAPYLRHRDEDILPFPLTDTIYLPEVCNVMGSNKRTVLYLLEEGAFEGYKLTPLAPWRISRKSFAEYFHRACQGIAAAADCRNKHAK